MSQDTKKGSGLVLIAALGIVYGDIGTSPLYALRECFYGVHAATVTPEHIFGVLSLIFWSLLLIITAKYLLFIMRMNNQGEGGILALMQLVLPENKKEVTSKFILMVGLFGAALLYGDGILTPAISVLSAVEGVQIVASGLEPYVVPITIAILLFLFWLQRRGTGRVGKLFGPVMLVWFAVLGITGLFHIVQEPQIFQAVNPWYAFEFLVEEKGKSLFILGAVFLVVTGGEAMYADLGHFGIAPIKKAWFLIVLPGLLLNYFGQGALLLDHPEYAINPFYHMAPEWALIPMILLAMLATIIASQAVISGAFSLTFQAIQLNYLPRLRIFHTSKDTRGQVFLPKINMLLCIATISVVLIFKSSTNLAVAYGIAITCTMVITDLLAFYALRKVWKWSLAIAILTTLVFLIIDLSFLTANALKILEGGWFPLAIALVVFICFRGWMIGQERIQKKLQKFKTAFSVFTKQFDRSAYAEVPGTAVYLTSDILNTPVGLQHNLKHHKAVHKKIIILEIGFKNTPYISETERMVIDDAGNDHGTFYRVLVKYGYMQPVHMNSILLRWKKEGLIDDEKALTFFLSRDRILVETKRPFYRIEDLLYVFLRRNSQDATRYFDLPPDQVYEIGMQIKL